MSNHPEINEELSSRTDEQLVQLLQAYTTCLDRVVAQLATRGISVEYDVLTLNTQPVAITKLNPSTKKVII